MASCECKQDGEARQDVAKTQTQIKHITDTHFTWIIYKNDTKEVIAALGGPCSISGESYTEMPQYGFGIGESFAGLRDKEQRFTWKVEGDRWNLKGRITLGTKLDEVWERVKQ